MASTSDVVAEILAAGFPRDFVLYERFASSVQKIAAWNTIVEMPFEVLTWAEELSRTQEGRFINLKLGII